MTDVDRPKRTLFGKFQKKATAVLYSVTDLVTDAAPSKPRSEKALNKLNARNRSSEWIKGRNERPEEDDDDDDDEDEDDINDEYSPNSHSKTKSNFPNKKKTKDKKPRNQEFSNSTIIKNCSKVHIGTSYTQNFNASRDRRPFKKHINITPKIKELLSSCTPCLREHLLCIKQHVGDNWMEVGTRLGLSTGQLAQLKADHSRNGQGEVVYQMLLSWTQEHADNASLGVLCCSLWSSDEQDAVAILADEMTKNFD